MSPDELYLLNLSKLDLRCSCGKTYGIDHPENKGYIADAKDIVNTCEKIIFSYGYYRRDCQYPLYTLRDYSHFRVNGLWCFVNNKMKEKFLKTFEISEGLAGSIRYPKPIDVTRQVDIYTLAKKLGIDPNLNESQVKRAKGKAFVELVKKNKI